MNASTTTQRSINTNATGSSVVSNDNCVRAWVWELGMMSTEAPCSHPEKRAGYEGSSAPLPRSPLGICTRRYSSPHEPTHQVVCLSLASARDYRATHLSEHTGLPDHPTPHTRPPLSQTAMNPGGPPRTSSPRLSLIHRRSYIAPPRAGTACMASRCM